MLRVLITGNLGTLGRPLEKELLSRGYEVFGCDLKHSENPKHMRADIANMRQLERVFEWCNPDVVYSLAAEFGRNNGEDYYEQLWTSNCLGTRNVIEACLKHNSHMVFASSSEAYGELDVEEGQQLHEGLLETEVPLFHNEYALSKWANEKQVQIAIKNRGLRATILRFFNAYGPGEHYHPYRSVVCLFTYRMLAGEPITIYKNYHRVFMYVDDWARTAANVAGRVVLRKFSNGSIFNIGGSEYVTVEDMYNKLSKLIPESQSVVTYLDKEAANVTNKRPDNSKAEYYLGHNPAITLDQGLPLTVDWMRKTYFEN